MVTVNVHEAKTHLFADSGNLSIIYERQNTLSITFS